MRLARPFLAFSLSLTGAPLAAQTSIETRGEQVQAAADATAAGEFDRARQILLRLLDASPDDPDLLRRLAMVEARDGRLDVAMDKIDRAILRAPDDVDIALARAYILYWRGELANARSAVAAIAARDPQYPDLAELSASLERKEAAQGLRLRALSIGAGISSIELRSGSKQTWNNQNVAVAVDASPDDTLTFDVMREERRSVDTRFSLRADHRIEDGYVYLAGTVVPKADFLEQWSVSAGSELSVVEGLDALADLRIAEYKTNLIVAFQPGLRFALNDDLSVTGRAINIFGGGEDYRFGGSLRLDYKLPAESSLFAIVASYPDVEEDGIRQLRSAAAGLKIPLSENIALSAVGSYENRDNSYRRCTGTLALNYRFGAP